MSPKYCYRSCWLTFATTANVSGMQVARSRLARDLKNLGLGSGGNAMGALVTAWHNRTPLVVTAGQQDRRHISLDPMLSVNLTDLALPYVKRSHEPYRAEDVPREIVRAYHTAMHPPRGPVFVSIPMDDWDAQAEAPPPRRIFYESEPAAKGIEEFARALAEAKRPAIVAGRWRRPSTGDLRHS